MLLFTDRRSFRLLFDLAELIAAKRLWYIFDVSCFRPGIADVLEHESYTTTTPCYPFGFRVIPAFRYVVVTPFREMAGISARFLSNVFLVETMPLKEC